MIIFIKLLLAHLLGDFILQPNSWITDKENKRHKSIYLYLHTLIHGVLAIIFIRELAFITFAIVLALSHGIIDFLKLHYQKANNKRTWFIVDQLLHIGILILIVMWYENQVLDFNFFGNQFWIFITGLVLLSKPASVLIKNIISIWTPESNKEDSSLANAGNYIGILERLFVFTFILTGHFEAIGFLLAAKSIFRFGDLKEAKDRKLTEYVLIGTLLSFGIALVIGLLSQYALLQLF